MYYWREKGESKDDTGLDVYHWHGPGVVCVAEPPANLDLSLLDRCYPALPQIVFELSFFRPE